MKSRRTTTASMHRARKIRASGFASLSCGRRDDAEMPSIRCCSGCSDDGDDGDGGDDDDDDDDDHNGHTHGGEGVDANSDADFWPLSYHNKEMLHFKMIVLMQPKRGALTAFAGYARESVGHCFQCLELHGQCGCPGRMQRHSRGSGVLAGFWISSFFNTQP